MFGRGEKPQEFPHVRIEETALEGYRYANWDPYILLDDINAAAVEAGAESKHLWASSERLQMTAAYTWLASARQSIGNTLVGQTEKNGRIPTDAAKIAEANYVAAQDWLEVRELMRGDTTFTLDDPSFDVRLTWPQPGNEPISNELFEATKKATDDLIAFNLPNVLTSIDRGMFFPPEFTQYDERVLKEIEKIKARQQVIERLWGGRLNPNIRPGSDIYKDLVKIIEDVVAFGVHALAPMTGDETFRLIPEERAPSDLPLFRPTLDFVLPTPAEPELPAFDPTTQVAEEEFIIVHEEVTVVAEPEIPLFDPAAETTPTLPAFDPRPAAEQAPALPFFNPAAETSEPVPGTSDETAEPALPFFDPAAEAAANVSEPETPALQFFDPRAEREQDQADERETGDEGPALPYFNPRPED